MNLVRETKISPWKRWLRDGMAAACPFVVILFCVAIGIYTHSPEYWGKRYYAVCNHPRQDNKGLIEHKDVAYEEVTRELAAAGAWECVSAASKANFTLHVEAKKKMVFNSPRTWLTPSVLDNEGNVLWESKTNKADATMFNGFRCTNACISIVIDKGFPCSGVLSHLYPLYKNHQQ